MVDSCNTLIYSNRWRAFRAGVAIVIDWLGIFLILQIGSNGHTDNCPTELVTMLFIIMAVVAFFITPKSKKQGPQTNDECHSPAPDPTEPRNLSSNNNDGRIPLKMGILAILFTWALPTIQLGTVYLISQLVDNDYNDVASTIVPLFITFFVVPLNILIILTMIFSDPFKRWKKQINTFKTIVTPNIKKLLIVSSAMVIASVWTYSDHPDDRNLEAISLLSFTLFVSAIFFVMGLFYQRDDFDKICKKLNKVIAMLGECNSLDGIGPAILISPMPGAICVAWEKPILNPKYYQIMWTREGKPYLPLDGEEGNRSTTERLDYIPELEEGQLYRVRVRACYNGAVGPWSPESTITVRRTE